jgi:glutamine amidotransferase/cyclase
VVDAKSPADIARAEKLVFPGVGAFGQAVANLKAMGLWDALHEYLQSGRPFFGICVGFQMLFDGSEESEGAPGLGFFKGTFEKFRPVNPSERLSVPHMGWNGLRVTQLAGALNDYHPSADKVYFVHSYRVLPNSQNKADVLAVTDYEGTPPFVSAVSRGNVMGTQFHPEKSGAVGLQILRNFLEGVPARPRPLAGLAPTTPRDVVLASAGGLQLNATAILRTIQHCGFGPTVLAKRVVACLDVRSNDAGDLVVTKGYQYDVREAADAGAGAADGEASTASSSTSTTTSQVKGRVRNFGGPVVRG